MNVFKNHCGACHHEWVPSALPGSCPRCGSGQVRAGALPPIGPRRPEKGSYLSYLWVALGIFGMILVFGFAGCSRLFFPGKAQRRN